MHLDWLLSPVTMYAASTLSLMTSLAVVVRVKIALARERCLPAPAAVTPIDDGEVRGLKIEMEQLRDSVCRLEETMPARGSAAGMNITKRAVALRMHRRGEPVSIIASALETPSNEVALLLKVHALTNVEKA